MVVEYYILSSYFSKFSFIAIPYTPQQIVLLVANSFINVVSYKQRSGMSIYNV